MKGRISGERREMKEGRMGGEGDGWDEINGWEESMGV